MSAGTDTGRTSATEITLDDLAAAASDERVTSFHVRDVRLPSAPAPSR